MKEEKLVIWYSNSYDNYRINTATEVRSGISDFSEDFDNILYIMEENQHKIAEKIKDRLNDVRNLVMAE
ncbi:MAG: hypothetical protein WBA74_05845 [Cyclobacteriaceae bacterium]